MYEKSHEKTPSLLISSAEVSPVRTSQAPASRGDWTVRDPACSSKCRESFAKLDPKSGSWKTSQTSLLSDFQTFSERWPNAGMMRGGAVSEHPTWEHHTSETGGFVSRGGWPTPRTCTAMQAQITPQRALDKNPNLETVMARQMWPTPLSTDYIRMSLPPANMEWTGGIVPAVMRSMRDGHTQMPHKKWPTPIAHDAKDQSLPASRITQTDGVVGEVMRSIKAGHTETPQERPYLSADWVEMLMGFPAGWTLLDTDGQLGPDHSPPESPHESEENGPEIESD